MRQLGKHRNMHTDVQYTCEHCTQKFTSKENFYAHCASHVLKKKHDPNVKFSCDICSKSFKTKGSIRNHMLLHTGNISIGLWMFCSGVVKFVVAFVIFADKYDHVCEICGWKFQSKGNLKGHLASTHVSAKPFPCEICKRWYIHDSYHK